MTQNPSINPGAAIKPLGQGTRLDITVAGYFVTPYFEGRVGLTQFCFQGILPGVLRTFS
ncbi:MAG: hypothetical protein Q8L89_08250 [Gammaproteobacteria bacterium]|jgi:hypothetical protein|nr:hypothetical protein [Gammaproteobacteria bacterium]